MLQTQTVTPELLEVIQEFQNDEWLEAFFLVGGTSLALRLGHRISVDIDLFSRNSFDNSRFLEHLEK